MKMVRIKNETHERLKDVPPEDFGETFDTIINRALDCYDKHCRRK